MLWLTGARSARCVSTDSYLLANQLTIDGLLRSGRLHDFGHKCERHVSHTSRYLPAPRGRKDDAGCLEAGIRVTVWDFRSNGGGFGVESPARDREFSPDASCPRELDRDASVRPHVGFCCAHDTVRPKLDPKLPVSVASSALLPGWVSSVRARRRTFDRAARGVGSHRRESIGCGLDARTRSERRNRDDRNGCSHMSITPLQGAGFPGWMAFLPPGSSRPGRGPPIDQDAVSPRGATRTRVRP
jgi:hypothetical protein